MDSLKDQISELSTNRLDPNELSKKIVNQISDATNKQAKAMGLGGSDIKPLSSEKGKDIDEIRQRVDEIQKMVKQMADTKSGKRGVEVKTSFSSQE